VHLLENMSEKLGSDVTACLLGGVSAFLFAGLGHMFGLAGYVHSSDRERAKRVARQVRAGIVTVNMANADPAAPFGGYRQSGNGREWGQHGIEEYLEIKAVMGWNAA
jgi:acyl-CoA reductase-like NAD-dependent aldehyde dehydrogenase